MRTLIYLAGGGLYDKDANFSKKYPGEQAGCSNIAFGLLGFIVEKVTGLRFNIYCVEHIFGPLEMASTGWFTTEIILNRHRCSGCFAAPFFWWRIQALSRN